VCAIKHIVIPKEELLKSTISVMKEFDLLKKLDHPNIVRLIEAFRDKEEICLVTELCKGDTLINAMASRNDGFTEDEVASIILQLLQAVNYCHKSGICHRDIKCDNIIIEDAGLQIKLIDFGLACLFDPEKGMTGKKGTTMYMAPEVIVQRGAYTESSDMWSIGVVAFTLLANTFPFPWS